MTYHFLYMLIFLSVHEHGTQNDVDRFTWICMGSDLCDHLLLQINYGYLLLAATPCFGNSPGGHFVEIRVIWAIFV